jgi:[protein-PII] uridylyltransferase
VVQPTGLSRVRRTLSFVPDRVLTADFKAENDRIVLTRDDAFGRDPVNIMRVFELCNSNDMRPHPHTVWALRRSLRLIDDEVRAHPEANAIFLRLLTGANDVGALLHLMNETGVLGQFVPEFGRVVGMMQFNMYHSYTVDEHLIRAVDRLARIERGQLRSEHPLASQLAPTIHNRRALYVAMFLHDIAKGRPEDHSEAGAAIARTLGPRLGLTPAETELAAWLVLEHLTMSITAQQRDLSDPRTVDHFGRTVQSFERLKLLEILTEADIAAVGPNVWNGWKGQLLHTLFDETEAILAARHTRRPRPARIEAKRRAFAEHPGPVKADARQWALDHHGAPYWIRVSTEDALYHTSLVASGDPAAVIVGFRMLADRAVTEMTLIAKDAPRLLAIVAAACSAAQANVVSADVFTTDDNIAVDVFAITPLSDDPRDEKARVERIAATVRRALAEGIAIPRPPDRRPRAVREAFHHPTDVLVANDWSERYTAIEVSGLDRPELFRDLTAAIMDLSLNIRSAQIATFGERVVDVFYVTGEDAEQVTDGAEIARIRATLTAAYDRRAVARPV